MSALALSNETSPFQCGISVAPVTTKRYYGECVHYEPKVKPLGYFHGVVSVLIGE